MWCSYSSGSLYAEKTNAVDMAGFLWKRNKVQPWGLPPSPSHTAKAGAVQQQLEQQYAEGSFFTLDGCAGSFLRSPLYGLFRCGWGHTCGSVGPLGSQPHGARAIACTKTMDGRCRNVLCDVIQCNVV